MHVFFHSLHTNSTCVSSQNAGKEGEVVFLQDQLQETTAKMTELDGECRNGTLLKAKNERLVPLQIT